MKKLLAVIAALSLSAAYGQTITNPPVTSFANPTATAGPAAVNGSATTAMRSDGAPAIQQGSATQKGIVQVDGTTITASGGVISSVGGGATGANPTATAGPTANNGVATTFMRSDASPAVQVGSASQEGIVQVDGTTIKASAGVISAPPVSTSRTVTGTTDTILAADLGNIVYYNSASAVAITQPAPTGSFAAGFFVTLCNINSGLPTVTPGSGNIGGAGTFALPIVGTASNPACASYQSDGTNFNLVPSYNLNASIFTAGTLPAARGGAGTINGALKGNGSGVVSQAACADLSNGTALCSTTPGTGVATAAGNALSANGGLTGTIASGTAALGTSAIASGACATVVTATATNTATTDVVLASFNGDPTAVTGYIPATAGMLTIITYPTANTFNAKVCNNTSSSITPGAITLNWRVLR